MLVVGSLAIVRGLADLGLIPYLAHSLDFVQFLTESPREALAISLFLRSLIAPAVMNFAKK